MVTVLRKEMDDDYSYSYSFLLLISYVDSVSIKMIGSSLLSGIIDLPREDKEVIKAALSEGALPFAVYGWK